MKQNQIIDDEIIKNVIMQGLRQIDPDLTIDNFSTHYDKSKRKLHINFTTTNQDGESVTMNNVWG